MKWRRPVLFTEIGYRSADGAAWRQWEIPAQRHGQSRSPARRLRGLLRSVWNRPWVAGVYPWKWFSAPATSGEGDNGYEIENKPAEEVVRRYYR